VKIVPTVILAIFFVPLRLGATKMKLILNSCLLATLLIPHPAIAQEPQMMGTKELVKTRCATDGSDTYIEWNGSVYAFVPQEKQQKLFDIIGMSVARCLQNQEGKWFITSRELAFYLDPKTGQILNRWQNPWTKEVVPVVHVANNPVQSPLSVKSPVKISRETAIFSFDLLLTYPNVLATDPKFRNYSSEPLYQAGDFFKFIVPVEQLTNSSLTTATDVSGSWTRVSPWLPWMKMQGKSGQLVYSTSLKKTSQFEELSPLIQQQISTRLPIYRSAPKCFLDAKNETSWTYFQKHYDRYLQGAQFPIPEEQDPPCRK
jgi:Protein of unknown function (DUF1838)